MLRTDIKPDTSENTLKTMNTTDGSYDAKKK